MTYSADFKGCICATGYVTAAIKKLLYEGVIFVGKIDEAT